MSRVESYVFGPIYEGQNLPIKARIVTDAGVRVSSDGDGSTTVPATAVEVKVYDVEDRPPVLKNATTAVAAATAFTSQATGYLNWVTDSEGYNFLVVVPIGSGSGFTVDFLGGHTYRVEVKVSTAATINPGAQAEGANVFVGHCFVEPMLGQT